VTAAPLDRGRRFPPSRYATRFPPKLSGRHVRVPSGVFPAYPRFYTPWAADLQFRFEACNLPNHLNWANPKTNLLTAGFGQIAGTLRASRGTFRKAVASGCPHHVSSRPTTGLALHLRHGGL